MSTKDGVKFPTVTSGIGNNPQESAMLSQQNNNAKLNALNKVGGAIAVPQMTMSYTGSNGSQNPNNQITDLTKIATNQTAQKVYDQHAVQKGGKTKKQNAIWKALDHFCIG